MLKTTTTHIRMGIHAAHATPAPHEAEGGYPAREDKERAYKLPKQKQWEEQVGGRGIGTAKYESSVQSPRKGIQENTRTRQQRMKKGEAVRGGGKERRRGAKEGTE